MISLKPLLPPSSQSFPSFPSPFSPVPILRRPHRKFRTYKQVFDFVFVFAFAEIQYFLWYGAALLNKVLPGRERRGEKGKTHRTWTRTRRVHYLIVYCRM